MTRIPVDSGTAALEMDHLGQTFSADSSINVKVINVLVKEMCK